MPPDILLMLASSGLTLVASLLFFVSEERPPRSRRSEPEVSFCLPPHRLNHRRRPPPLPANEPVVVETEQGVVTLRLEGEVWVVSMPIITADTPLRAQGTGRIDDLRWHGQAGVARRISSQWKQRPGQA